MKKTFIIDTVRDKVPVKSVITLSPLETIQTLTVSRHPLLTVVTLDNVIKM